MHGLVRGPACCAILVLVTAFQALADRIELKNGQRVEGVITQETDQGIVLNVSGGNITFKRAQVKAIVRSGQQENGALESAWRDKRFLEKDTVPQGLDALAALFRGLEARRRDAIAAGEGMSRADETLRRLELERTKVRDDLTAASSRLEKAAPEADPKGYNDLVALNNSLRAGLTRRQTDLENEMAERPKRMKAISDYLASLQTCSQSLAQVQASWKTTSPDPDAAQQFIGKAKSLLNGYAADFRQSGIQPTLHGNATLVSATINGRAVGSFIIDTGAEVMTMSRAFAETAGVPMTEDRPMNLVMADGRQLKAFGATLSSVKLGDIETRDVTAVILPNPPDEGIDGLLGMNILKTFLVRVDPATGRLHLEHFSPR
jgi:clan AA aspartic protease (TIGR02281 family)